MLLGIGTYAQAPQGIPYQAIARNSSGAILASTAISVRFTIRDSVATGAIKYRETFSVTTTAQGMFSVNVGQGTPITGTFSGINWGTNAKFMQVEMDPAGGTSYIDMGTTQMMSVPYSLNSGSLKLRVSATGDTLYSGGGNYVIIPGISAANCFVSAGTITGSSTVGVGTTVALSSSVAGGTWSSSNSSVASVGSTGIVTGIAAGTATITYTKTALCGIAVSTKFVTVNPITLPTISTATVGAIVSCAASSGGVISSDGGNAITARGVVWSTTTNPTISLTTKTINGTGAGAFVSSMNGLTASTTYYVRAYATNSVGTSYGAEYSFTTLAGTMCIGASYGGGKIAYIFQPGDPGYIAGEVHGIIAANGDQASSVLWGCAGTLTGASDQELLGGIMNTSLILSACPSVGTAPYLCQTYGGGGYTDWYLPSIKELSKLYDNRLAIGGFSAYGEYWSSTESNAYNVITLYFLNGSWNGSTDKGDSPSSVRAIRSF